MNQLLPLFMALALCGCRPTPSPPAPPTLPTEADLTAAASQWGGGAVCRDWLAAVAPEPNRAAIVARYLAAAETNQVLYLVGQSPTELRRKLDTLERGTATHGFTRAQLETAIRLKEERKAAKTAAAAARKAEEDARLNSPLMPTEPAGQ